MRCRFENGRISQLGRIGCDNGIGPVCGDGLKKKKQPEPNLEFETLVANRQIIITMPLKLANEANSADGWRKKHERHKAQKKAVFVAMLPVKEIIKLPCTLKVTRYAPKLLDRHDNLPYSCKWVMDQLCAEITGDLRPGRADNYEGFTFQYDQIKSKIYAIKIEITW
jgi:hypothetical protein